jgi:nicotinate-nucleotide adenylyltransferase
MIQGEQKRRVALFGGSFNPPHKGHTAICRWLARLGVFEEIWLLPCYIHPLGKHLIPYDARLEMCKLAFGKLNLPIHILEVEKELGGESRTLRTIEHLTEKHPGIRFSFVVGSDIEAQEKHWHRFDCIRELVDIVKIPRGPESPIPDVSSTDIRRRIGANKPYRDLIEPEVAVYIITKALYRDEESTKE